MPAYAITNVNVKDAAPDTITRHGGRCLVRGGTHQTLEGAWQPSRLVVLVEGA